MSDSQESNSRRSKPRFVPKEFRNWVLRVDGKVVPSQWFIDLSQGGLGIRLGRYGCYEVGDELEIQLELDAVVIVKGVAHVKWRQPFEDSINMFELGLMMNSYSQFEDSIALPLADLNRIVRAEDIQPPLKTPVSSHLARIFQVIFLVIVPFFLGFTLQMQVSLF